MNVPLHGAAHNAYFLDPGATLVAVSGFSGDIEVVAIPDGQDVQQRLALPVAESGTVVQPVPSTHENGVTLVTRAPSGLTNIWLVGTNEQAPAARPVLGTITDLASASGPTGGWVAATDGTPSVSLWRLPEPTGRQAPAVALTHSEQVERVAVTTKAGQAAVAVIGDTHAALWVYPRGYQPP